MAELTAADVEAFTAGELPDDERTQLMLDVALTVARSDAGWNVCPVMLGDQALLDGPESRILTLPTMKLINLISITEDGKDVPLSTLNWSVGGPPGIASLRPVSVRKKSRQYWSCNYQAIVVTMDHGFTEVEAADWRYAVMTMVSQMPSYAAVGRTDADMTMKSIDDVTYRWIDRFATTAKELMYSMDDILNDYQLPRVEFL